MKRDGMGEAIALSSPSGRMSKRARKAAIDRLATTLFSVEHDDNCACKSCQLEKTYLVNLICSSVEGEELSRLCVNWEDIMDKETSELNDQQRAHLLQLYKLKLQELGDDVFFDKFDEIREECYKSIGISSKEESILFYVDPIHSAASTLGHQGGSVRSEVKSTAARENGKKGGRPSKQLDIEDI